MIDKKRFFRLLALFSLCLASPVANSQSDWVFHALGLRGQAMLPNVFNHVQLDDSGNLYLGSGVVDSTRFGPFGITGTSIAPGYFLNAGYLAKLNAQGVPQWIRIFKGTGQYNILDLNTDGEGNILTVGILSGKVALGGTEYQSNFSSGDCFLVKFDRDGNVLWTFLAKSQAGFSYSVGRSVDCNSSDDVVISGHVVSNVDIGVNQIRNSTHTFLATFSKDGSLRWVRTYGFYSPDHSATEIAIDANDDIFWVGRTLNASNGDPTQFDTISFQAYSGTLFLGKFNPDGDVIWLKNYGADPNSGARIRSNNIALDANDGSVTMAGVFQDTVQLEHLQLLRPTPLGIHLFVARFTGDGTLLWAKQSKGPADDVSVYDVDVTPDGSSLVAMSVGSTIGLADFVIGEGASQHSVAIDGSANGVVAKYSSAGKALWLYGNSGTGQSPVHAIAHAGNDACIVSGIFTEETQIGDSVLTPGPQKYSANLYVASISNPTDPGSVPETRFPLLSVYPNPAGEKVHIGISGDGNHFLFDLHSSTGSLICQREVTGVEAELQLHDLPPGLYILQVKTELKHWRVKLIRP